MKLAILNDTHTGIRNSSEIFLDNAEKFYSEVFFPYIKEHNITQILHLGDYYDHRKFINFKALHRNRKMFLAVLREEGLHMDVICGNHDTYYKNTNELNSLKELLGHYMNEVSIIHDPTVCEYGGLKVALVPWINSENEKESLDFIRNCKADIMGGHFELSGFEMAKGLENTHGMDPSVFSNIHYLGSQMEFYWNDAHDAKYFHVLDTDTRELTAVRNPHTLFERIYYDDSKNNYIDTDTSYLNNKFVKIVVMNRSDMFMFDRFIDKVQNQQILELKIQENFSDFIGGNVADSDVSLEDTSSLLSSYIDAVDTELDRDRIKKQIHELMVEAESIEIA